MLSAAVELLNAFQVIEFPMKEYFPQKLYEFWEILIQTEDLIIMTSNVYNRLCGTLQITFTIHLINLGVGKGERCLTYRLNYLPDVLCQLTSTMLILGVLLILEFPPDLE